MLPLVADHLNSRTYISPYLAVPMDAAPGIDTAHPQNLIKIVTPAIPEFNVKFM